MRSIDGLREELAGWAADFDPTALTVTDCRAVLAAAVAIERIAATVKAHAAARLVDTGAWRSAGDRSPAHQLARETGTTVGAAREVLETGRRLDGLPELGAAARAGSLSPAQTAAVAAIGEVAPDLVPDLIDRAQQTSVAELREDCARLLATRVRDPDARRARIRAARSLRHWTDAGGVGVLQLRDAPDIIAGVLTDIAPAREALHSIARERGERPTPEALDADALVATVRTGRHGNLPSTGGHTARNGGGAAAGDDCAEGQHAAAAGDAGRPAVIRPPHRCAPRAKILVRVDFDALLRGRPIDGEVCEIAGYGPVPVSAVHDLLATGDPFLAAIVTKGEHVTGVAHLGRKALAHQASALEWINPTCSADGCTNHLRLETDHREPWATTKITLLDLLDRLCAHHHQLKTRANWALVDGSGKRAFVPPDDPRHPDHRSNARQGPRPARGDPTAA